MVPGKQAGHMTCTRPQAARQILLATRASSTHDPHVWSGRALQEDFVELAAAVLHQCIRSLVGAVLLRTIMDISARAFSLADRPRSGHSGHQCLHALGRPILHFVLSSRRPRLETVDRVVSLRLR